MKSYFLVFSMFVGFFACQELSKPKQKMKHTQDIHSFAKPEQSLMTHLDLDLKVDFTKRILSGKAHIYFDNPHQSKELILDTDKLAIKAIWLDGNEECNFHLDKNVEFLGQALHIPIKKNTKFVVVEYETSPEAAALQWLDPEQTNGKKSPFLFSQSQCILARSWIPCQDSPGIRFTYNATIQVPDSLMALMSAKNPTQKSANGTYHFEMKQKIPAYLVALAVGDLSFAPIDERTGIYAEDTVLQASQKEFEDLGKMVAAAEKIYGKYEWERYDLLILPPSFPFGGMENPRLTFATPTIIAGDKSLTSLVAHELAHSWSGNLVTNETWNDFWLNEGFTVYFERRIMEELYGKDYAEMLALLGYQDLLADIEEIGANSKDTKLLLDLRQRNPDEGVTEIAYEKGYFFLRMIEETIGREAFDSFVKGYFKDFAFQSMNTEGFVDYLEEKIIKGNKELRQKINYQDWIFDVGLPKNCPKVRSVLFERVDAELSEWKNTKQTDSLATQNWSSHEWLHFIRHLPKELSLKEMEDLDKSFNFTDSGNAEIQAAWFVHCIQHEYKASYKAIEIFLMRVGRRKFLNPIYTTMSKNKNTKALAIDIYQKARSSYHSLATNKIDEILGLKK
ncbi:MAG: M1 family metallopeptidase [Thermonemataceae bacterium]|nr:M1 family metallopeptidase [Thermonemataceae bacterium]